MIIDGTGDDFKRYQRKKKELEKIGYQTYMIFVNTTLEVNLKETKIVIEFYQKVLLKLHIKK